MRSLAARVSAKGPRILPFPDVPPDAPTWEGRVECHPRQEGLDYVAAAETLINQCKEGKAVNVFASGTYANRNRPDGKQVGAASAVLYQNGRDWKHRERIFGETVTESDMMLRTPLPALDILEDFLASQHQDAPITAVIALPSNPAVIKALKPTPHAEQNISLECLTKLGELMESHQNLKVRLLWLPRKTPFIGFKRAKQLALEAICTANPNPEDEPFTIKKQKTKTKEAVIEKWADRWRTTPHTSLAYRTALTKPPNGRPHPTFLAGKGPAKFSRALHCTLYRIITGHAFTGEYTQRFFNQHTPEQIACGCGEPIQTVEHILLNCPNHTAARRAHLTASGRPRHLPQLFDHPKRVDALLRFLQETKACAKPRMEWEPG